MSWWQAIILGFVQGLTEFLPVSSSGHLAIGRELLGIGAGGDLVFEVAVHAATAIAIIVVFWNEILRLLGGLFKFSYNDETKYILKICLSMIPVFIVGVFFKDYVEAAFGSLLVVGLGLVVTGILLALSDGVKKQGEEISWWQALVIGLGQALAVIPGLSRSGTTISTGLLCGVKRESVAQFSFLMVLVPVLGEAFLDVVGGEVAASSTALLPLVLGFIAAFVSGLLACKAMIALVKRAKMKWFALYCAVVGIIVIISQMV